MGVDELLRTGLLKKIPPSRERAVKSIRTAERFLDRARKNFDINLDDMAILAAYAAAFHAARAVLFSDGFGERSHFAVYEYLKERRKQIGLGEIEAFDAYRRLRHAVAYGLDELITEKDSKEAVNFAAGFVRRVKLFLKL